MELQCLAWQLTWFLAASVINGSWGRGPLGAQWRAIQTLQSMSSPWRHSKLRERDKEAVIGTKVTENNEEWTQSSSFMPIANGTDGVCPGGSLPSCTGHNVGAESRSRNERSFCCSSLSGLIWFSSYSSAWYKMKFDKRTEKLRNQAQECVDRKLSCLVVSQLTV